MTPTERRRNIVHRLRRFVHLTEESAEVLTDLREDLRREGLHDARDHLAPAKRSLRAAREGVIYARAAAEREVSREENDRD